MASRVMILDARASVRMLVASLLSASQYIPLVAADLPEAVRLARKAPPHAILLGLGSRDPSEILETLRARGLAKAKGETSPVICLDPDMTPERRVTALMAGARDLIQWPQDERVLLAKLRCVLREVHADQEIVRRENAAARFGFAEPALAFDRSTSVTVVTSQGENTVLTRSLKNGLGEDLRVIAPKQALGAQDGSEQHDVIVLDGLSLSRTKVFELLPEFRAREHARHAAMLVVHPKDDVDAAIQALDGGAADVISSDALESEMAYRVNCLLRRKLADDALRHSAENSMLLAVTDPLTGLYNRRYAEAYLADAIHNSRATAQPFTVMLLDIDHFKTINDTYGHAAGDAVLKAVGDKMKSNVRAIDLVARYGGEEFLVVLPETDVKLARKAADRLRSCIAEMKVDVAGDNSVHVTVSVGVAVSEASIDQSGKTLANAIMTSAEPVLDMLLSQADSALYSAKSAGRNRVELSASHA
ncbi:MAG: diguanylate cyclase [Boseongicola sp.]|nr:diguanylate cyclase [Boseongicola sp.]